MITKKHDVAIVGAGIAGIVSAIQLAKQNLDIALIYDQSTSDCASIYAQGGIAAITSDKDSTKNHIQDTFLASGKIAKIDSINQVVESSYTAIKWLEKHGVIFDKKANGEYSLHLEGGHSLPRILHIKDYTGRAIVSGLYKNLDRFANISIYSQFNVFKLIKNVNKCIGLYSCNKDYQVVKFLTKKVILAAGGASGIYKYVTNTAAGIGSAMIMAYDIGCRLENLEFTQFHPTCFFANSGEPILISEAIRGYQAVLETKDGLRIMQSAHRKQDLAPRDIVARQIYTNMQSKKDIYLNATHLNTKQWQENFPCIYQKLLDNNIDPTKQRIPVFPAAHYSCGGINVDKNSQTDIQGLYAVGEVSYTGLHGANRLASNSLLECIVYALKASKHILKNFDDGFSEDEKILELFVSNTDYSQDISRIKEIMWSKVGLVRQKQDLFEAYQQLKLMQQSTTGGDITQIYDYKLEAYKKIVKLAKLTVKQAIDRKQSVGSHFIRKSNTGASKDY